MDIEAEGPKLLSNQDQEPYTLENLPIYISINDSTVAISSTILQITEEGFTFLQEKDNEQWFTINATFANTTSVGLSGDSMMIFIGDEEIEEEEQTPQILKTISACPAGANVCLNGYCFTITVDFKNEGKNVLKQVHDIFINYMGDADERRSRYDDDEDFEQMISADDIDENGNIIGAFKNEGESQSQGSEDSEEENINHSTQS